MNLGPIISKGGRLGGDTTGCCSASTDSLQGSSPFVECPHWLYAPLSLIINVQEELAKLSCLLKHLRATFDTVPGNPEIMSCESM